MQGEVVDFKTELLTVEEAARVLNIGRTTAYKLVGSGELPVVRMGRATRIPRHSLLTWIDSRVQYGCVDGRGA